jgi:hypothetical protein
MWTEWKKRHIYSVFILRKVEEKTGIGSYITITVFLTLQSADNCCVGYTFLYENQISVLI